MISWRVELATCLASKLPVGWLMRTWLVVCMVGYGMVEVYEGAPVAVIVSGWVLTDRHDLAPCAANCKVCSGNHISVNNIIRGTGTLGIA